MLDVSLYEMITEVQRITGRNDPEWAVRIEAAVRRAYHAWESEFAWRDLYFEDEITYYGDQPYLVVPQDVDQIVWVMDATNYQALKASDKQWDRRYPYAVAQNLKSYAEEWEPVGYRPFSTFVSTHTLTVEYLVSGGLPTHTVQFQVRGYWQVTGATLANNRYEALYEFSTSTTLASIDVGLGQLLVEPLGLNLVSAQTCPVVFKSPDNDIVGLIPPGARQSTYYWLKLLYRPESGTKFRYGAIRRLRPVTHFSLYADTILPGADPEYLTWRAASDIYTEMQEPERALLAYKRAEIALKRQREKEVLFSDHANRIIPEDLE